MLSLTRKIGEAVLIGSDIRVVVLERFGQEVRLGIEAPRETKILREEIAPVGARERRVRAGRRRDGEDIR